MSRLHSAYKVGHYRQTGDGKRSLVWTPTQGDIGYGDVIEGSRDWAGVMAEEEYLLNALQDGGENAILETFFRANHTPTFYLGLSNDGVLVETDTIVQIGSEQTGAGYARIAVARGVTDWGAAALDAGDHMSTSATKTWTATGAWIASTELILVSSAAGTTGTFYAWTALTTSRTLASTDTLDVSMAVKLA